MDRCPISGCPSIRGRTKVRTFAWRRWGFIRVNDRRVKRPIRTGRLDSDIPLHSNRRKEKHPQNSLWETRLKPQNGIWRRSWCSAARLLDSIAFPGQSGDWTGHCFGDTSSGSIFLMGSFQSSGPFSLGSVFFILKKILLFSPYGMQGNC